MLSNPKNRLFLLLGLLGFLAVGILNNLQAYLINQIPPIEKLPVIGSYIPTESPAKENFLLLISVGIITLIGIPSTVVFLRQAKQVADTPTHTQIVGSTLQRQEARYRKGLLGKVRKLWLTDVLEQSLFAQARIELGLEECFGAVHFWGMEHAVSQRTRQPLAAGVRVIDKLRSLGEGATLLLLGEPGSGKTTTLLELARDLLQDAESDPQAPVPVVFNLSSWGAQNLQKQNRQKSNKPETLTDWLVTELDSKYRVPRPLGQTWVQQEQLMLLLDGLDEVSPERRNACIEAINQFQQDHGITEMIVCCRAQDFEALSTELRFQAALYIQPLTSNQIDIYLQQSGADLAGIRIALQAEPELQQTDPNSLQSLATSPLFLWVMSQAYCGMSADQILQMESVDRRTHLFDEYIKSQLEKEEYPGYRRELKSLYPSAQVKYWLKLLAQKMMERSETIFLIEAIQPSDFGGSSYQKFAYEFYLYLIAWIILVPTLSLFVYGASVMPNAKYLGIASFFFSPLFILVLFLYRWSPTRISEIRPVEELEWSWRKGRKSIISLFEEHKHFDPVSALLAFVTGGWIPKFQAGKTISPNQGIRNTIVNCVKISLVSSLPFCLIMWLPFVLAHRFEGVVLLPEAFLVAILSIAPISILINDAGLACIQHLALRIVLFQTHIIPWNYTKFLDYAADRLFLQKVGGGYIFIHRMLLEHFAQLKLEDKQ